MNNKIDLSIIIPAYLEEENLRLILPRIMHVSKEMYINFEILIIGPSNELDNTKLVCEQHGGKYFNRENGNNYGDAVKTGIKKSVGKYILFMDADGSHSPEFIPTLFQKSNEYDVIVASRYVTGGTSDNKKILIFMSYIVNYSYSILFHLKCKDISNSFKLYNGEDLKSLNLTCKHFDIIQEILIKLKRKNRNIKIKEIPFTFRERFFGHTKRNLIAFFFAYVYTILKLRFLI